VEGHNSLRASFIVGSDDAALDLRCHLVGGSGPSKVFSSLGVLLSQLARGNRCVCFGFAVDRTHAIDRLLNSLGRSRLLDSTLVHRLLVA
jgi:hypothetical protein